MGSNRMTRHAKRGIRNEKIKEWRISLWWLVNVVTLPLPCTPSCPVWYPIITCLELHLHQVYHHLHLVYHHLSGTPPFLSVPHHPCLVPHHSYLVPYHPCLVSHHITGTPPLSGIPSCVWNPIPSPVWYPIPVPHCHHLAHSTPPHLVIAAPICHLTTPCPLIWPLPAHPLELLLHATPTTPINCHLALIHPAIPSLQPSGPPCPTAPAASGSLLSASCPTTLLPHHPLAPPPPQMPHLSLLSPAIPSLPCHLALLVPTPCPILLPAIAPPAPTTPTPVWTSCPHPTKYPKVPFTQKGNLSFSKFPSFPMFVSISPCVGSISSLSKIISFILHGKIPKIVVKQPRFHQ